MTIWNLGSINVDYVLRVPYLSAPGETIIASGFSSGLGGKGANHSIAAARAGAVVHHLGAVGEDGEPWVAQLEAAGVRTRHVMRVSAPTGRADIRVDDAGENSIVVLSGANAEIPMSHVASALDEAVSGDLFLLQNETNAQVEAAWLAKERGLRVVYSAAPFNAHIVTEVLPAVSILIVNEVEAAQLAETLGREVTAEDVPVMVVTRGAEGAIWRDLAGDDEFHTPTPNVEAVDTTGAGDTFSGYLAASLDAGLPPKAAMARAAMAAALSVTRRGAADSIPRAAEVDQAKG